MDAMLPLGGTEDEMEGPKVFLVWLNNIESNLVTKENEHVRSI